MKFQSAEIFKLFACEGGIFTHECSVLLEKWSKIKAIILDWDGVFNDGHKFDSTSSTFSETDAMGLNLLRYALYLKNGYLPPAAVLTGMNNSAAVSFTKREHFSHCYYGFKDKIFAFNHFLVENHLAPDEVTFWFDDILDFSVARAAGLRINISQPASHLLKQYILQEQLADYITAKTGGVGAIRESCELLLGLNGNFQEIVHNRSSYADSYASYFIKRQAATTLFFTTLDHQTPVSAIL
jgi:3-deoxy-D-manno-octulosonate 8-phosphate phosphatase (KDO 8-P phosphatase)